MPTEPQWSRMESNHRFLGVDQVSLPLDHGTVYLKWSHGESHPDLRNAIASSCYWTMTPKWSARPDLHRVRAGLQAAASTISASRAFGNGEADGCCPRSAIFTGSNAGCYITASV